MVLQFIHEMNLQKILKLMSYAAYIYLREKYNRRGQIVMTADKMLTSNLMAATLLSMIEVNHGDKDLTSCFSISPSAQLIGYLIPESFLHLQFI